MSQSGNSFRHAELLTLTNPVQDNGHTMYCTSCTPIEAHHGGPVYGKREILIRKCAEHLKDQRLEH